MIFSNVKDNVRVYEAQSAEDIPAGQVKIRKISGKNVDGPVISVEEMRRADAYTIANFVPSKELMYRAAYGVFLAIRNYCRGEKNVCLEGGSEENLILSSNSPVGDDAGSEAASTGNEAENKRTLRVAIISGSGNNGGDGYALAQILNEHGAGVTIFRVSEKLSDDGAYYLDFCRKAQIPEVLLYEDLSADALPHEELSADALPHEELSADALPHEELSADALPHEELSADALPHEELSADALPHEELSADALPHADVSETADTTWEGKLAGFDIIVDCILGTGFAGAPRGLAAETIININLARGTSAPGGAAGCPYVVSVDINSGLNGDTGEAVIAVKSDLTVSIGYIKHGQLTENAAKYTGKLVCADIGILLSMQ